jgi:putative nucleotidyltransferase with HDIG domain
MKTCCENIFQKICAKDYASKLLFALHRYDPATYYHCCRTAKLALQLACDNMGVNDLEVLGEAAVLHDVGKLMIDKELLNKPGKLTVSESKIIKRHARYGESILRSLGVNEKVTSLIANHHPEKNDKHLEHSGPILKALVKADNIDAWMHARSYKPPFPKEKVTELLYSRFHDDASNDKAISIAARDPQNDSFGCFRAFRHVKGYDATIPDRSIQP